LVLEALYANEPVMTQLTDYGYGGFLVLKKEKNEPLKEALTLWDCRRPKDPTATIRQIVEVMFREVALLPEPIPWSNILLDTS
jgi:hypothetical protein